MHLGGGEVAHRAVSVALLFEPTMAFVDLLVGALLGRVEGHLVRCCGCHSRHCKCHNHREPDGELTHIDRMDLLWDQGDTCTFIGAFPTNNFRRSYVEKRANNCSYEKHQ